jgi:regulator of protease activity HflC (stomatin/prohibitin superfamily)
MGLFTDEDGYANPIKVGTVLTIAILVLIFVFSTFTVIGVGQVGVKVQFGQVVGQPLQSGFHFTTPFIQSVEKFDIKVLKEDIEASGASKDLQDIKTNISVNYRVSPSGVQELYKTVGRGYVQSVVRPATQEIVKAITAQYTAEELITKRQDVSSQMKTKLQERLNTYGILIDNVNIINFNFSEAFNQAIEQKQVAQQNALKAQQDLERIKIEAEQKIATARAEAESLKLQKQEITPDLIKLREIEAQLQAIYKWNGILPTYTGGQIPFINVNK